MYLHYDTQIQISCNPDLNSLILPLKQTFLIWDNYINNLILFLTHSMESEGHTYKRESDAIFLNVLNIIASSYFSSHPS